MQISLSIRNTQLFKILSFCFSVNINKFAKEIESMKSAYSLSNKMKNNTFCHNDS